MTRILMSKWFDVKLYRVTAWTNIISGAFGIFISMILNGGWYLVVWFPWVSEHEINLAHRGSLQFLVAYYASAFVITLIIECIANILFLCKEYSRAKLVRATAISNILSYAVGTFVLYSYSFR